MTLIPMNTPAQDGHPEALKVADHELPVFIEEREQARLGRFPGTAFGHSEICHAHGVYDIEVDTGSSDPELCVESVVSRMKEGPGTAFVQLRAQLISP